MLALIPFYNERTLMGKRNQSRVTTLTVTNTAAMITAVSNRSAHGFFSITTPDECFLGVVNINQRI